MSANRSFRTLKLQRTTNSVRNAVSLTTPSALNSTYQLTLPSAVPATTQALLSDATGTLSWGSISSAATQSTFSGGNNVSTPTSVTGLNVSSSPIVIPVYVFVNATASLAALFSLSLFTNASGGYTLEDDSVGDTTLIKFSVDSSGQVYYTSGNYTGFSSLTFKWYSPYTPVSSATASLSLSNALSVGTNTALATNNISGSPSAANGNFLFVKGSTFTDISTVSSGTANAFNATYFAAPVLSAANTSVTTTNASTLTIAGPPTAGKNETITNAYSLNVLAGASLFGGSITTTGLNVTGTVGITDAGLISVQYTAPNLSNLSANTSYYPAWTVNASTSKYPSTIVPTTLVASNGQINIPQAGVWRVVVDFYWQNSSATLSQANFAAYILGSKTVAGVPSSSGYLALQLTYEQYFSGPGSISAGSVYPNYSGATVNSLVMNITRIAR